MPTLLLEAVSLVTTRSVTNAVEAASDSSDPSGSSGHNAKAAEAGVIIGVIAALVLHIILHGLVKQYGLLRPGSKNFIFRRCCGKKREYCGPLEQDYQPYEMIRPQGQHHAEAGFNKGLEDVAVSEPERMLENLGR